MRQKTVFEINGVRYYSPKAFGDLHGLSSQKVVSACKKGFIVDATKDSSEHWIIPATSPKPLDEEQIKKILLLVLLIKNKPENQQLYLEQFNNENLGRLFSYLNRIGLVENFETFDMEHIFLTNNGISKLLDSKKILIDWLSVNNLIETVSSILSIIATTLQFFDR